MPTFVAFFYGNTNIPNTMAYIIDPELLHLCNDVILNKSDDAAELLIEYAMSHKDLGMVASTDGAPVKAWRTESIENRLRHAILKGITDFLQTDIDEARQRYSAMQIIEKLLMGAMNEVGELFGEGKMFLPQVVKSARVLRTAVNILQPYLNANNDTTTVNKSEKKDSKKILLATVKGDVHDIGKNIVSIVLACNGFEIIDLGVMIPAEQILEGIKLHRPDLVGLSGLITPSLDEMETVAAMINSNGYELPLLIGGATTTPLHTALHLDLVYPHHVFYVRDASQAAGIARQLTDCNLKHTYTSSQQRKNEELRRLHATAQQRRTTITLEDARRNKLQIDWTNEKIPALQSGISIQRDVAIRDLFQYINWSMFFYAWGFKGKYPAILQHPDFGKAVSQLFNDARNMLNRLDSDNLLQIRSVVGFFPAASVDEDILIYNEARSNVLTKINTYRQLQEMKNGDPNLALSDFIAPQDSGVRDCVGMFVLSVLPDNDMLLSLRKAGNEYDALLIETLCHRLAEAYAEYIVAHLPTPYLRVAVGYSSLPDHSQKRPIFDLLNVTKNIDAMLTESYMIQPAAAECGLLMASKHARYF
jgi:5-methyltetrahydrofolate--homocysteine methyltransferase